MVIFGGIRKKSPKCSELITAGFDSGATRTLPLDEQFWSVSGEACHGDEPGRMGQDTRGWRWDFWQGFQQPAPKWIARLKAPTRFGYVTNYPFGAFSDRQPGVDPIDYLIRKALANRGEAVEDRFVVPGKAQENVGINSDGCWL